jgi:hypothetical protein
MFPHPSVQPREGGAGPHLRDSPHCTLGRTLLFLFHICRLGWELALCLYSASHSEDRVAPFLGESVPGSAHPRQEVKLVPWKPTLVKGEASPSPPQAPVSPVLCLLLRSTVALDNGLDSPEARLVLTNISSSLVCSPGFPTPFALRVAQA